MSEDDQAGRFAKALLSVFDFAKEIGPPPGYDPARRGAVLMPDGTYDVSGMCLMPTDEVERLRGVVLRKAVDGIREES